MHTTSLQLFFGGEAIYSKIVSYGSEIPKINKGIYWKEEKEALGTALTNIVNSVPNLANVTDEDLDNVIAEAQATVQFNIGQ